MIKASHTKILIHTLYQTSPFNANNLKFFTDLLCLWKMCFLNGLRDKYLQLFLLILFSQILQLRSPFGPIPSFQYLHTQTWL